MRTEKENNYETMYAYSEVTFYGNGYKYKARTFRNYDDAKGCLMMYLHNGGMATALTAFTGIAEDHENNMDYIRQYYKSDEQVLTGIYRTESVNGKSYHEDYYLKKQCLNKKYRNDFNAISDYVDKGYDTVDIPEFEKIAVCIKTPEDKEGQRVEVSGPNMELIESVIAVLQECENISVHLE